MPTVTTGDGTGSATTGGQYSGLPNKLVRAANGIDYVYRDTGPGASGGVPLSCSSTSAETSTTGIPR